MSRWLRTTILALILLAACTPSARADAPLPFPPNTEREVGPGAVSIAPSNKPHGVRVLSDSAPSAATSAPPRTT